MGAMASQITSLIIVYSTVYLGADERKHQSSASLAFVWRIHRWPVNSPHKWPVTRNMLPFDDVIIVCMFRKSYSSLMTPELPYLQRLTQIRTWISNHTQCFLWGAITHPCPNVNGCFVVEVWALCYVYGFSFSRHCLDAGLAIIPKEVCYFEQKDKRLDNKTLLAMFPLR